jgi:hypothetical protein
MQKEIFVVIDFFLFSAMGHLKIIVDYIIQFRLVLVHLSNWVLVLPVLAEPCFSQIIFIACFKVQGGHFIKHKAYVPT